MPEHHVRPPGPGRWIVLTGGPGAGKTAVLELLRASVCEHVMLVREAASIAFGGGFPREGARDARRAAQRAIYHIQVELEALAALRRPAVIVCDRGVVDGAAYWPGPDDFFTAMGTTRAQALARYDAVIHLRVPRPHNGYGHGGNPLRPESADEARAIDERILVAWEGHPRRYFVDASDDFLVKVAAAVDALKAETPEPCRAHLRAVHGVRVAAEAPAPVP